MLHDTAVVAGLSFVGLELAELLAAPPSWDPNWKSKGPRVEVKLQLFVQAETYVQSEVLPADEAELVNEYRAALRGEDYSQALEWLAQLGERQDCTNPFWRVLEQLAAAVWPTEHMMDRRAKGQREAKIAAIRERAGGGASSGSATGEDSWRGRGSRRGSRRGRHR